MKRPTALESALVALIGVLVAWQIATAIQVGESQVEVRAIPQALADVLHEKAAGRSCVFASQYAYPQIAYGSGCDGVRLDLASANAPPLFETDDVQVFALALGEPPAGSLLDGLAWVDVSAGSQVWRLYVLSD